MEWVIGGWQLSVRRQPPTPTALAAMYDANAQSWHAQITGLGYPTAYRQLFARLLDERRLDIRHPTARVLDCGIGSGALSLALADALGACFQLDGVDIAPRMLADAGLRLHAAGVAATLHQQRVEQLSFADASFDAVICAHTVEHVPDLAAALNEMTRVLRPGAPLVLIVSRPGILTALMRFRWHAVAYAAGDVLVALGNAGITNVRLYPFGNGVPQHWSYAYLGCKHG